MGQVRHLIEAGATLAMCVCVSLCAADPVRLPWNLGRVEDTVTIPVEVYRKLLRDANEPSLPSICRVEGAIEKRGTQSVCVVKLTFSGRTKEPNVEIALGGKHLFATQATLGTTEPLTLIVSERGWSARILQPGEYVVHVSAEVPVKPSPTKPSEAQFEIGLPGSAITTLQLAPMAVIPRWTLQRKQLFDSPADTRTFDAERLREKPGEPLGSVRELVVSWPIPTDPRSAQERSASAETLVTIGEGEIVTECKLRLRGTATEWKVTAPATAEMQLFRGDGSEFPTDTAPTLLRPAPGGQSWSVRNGSVPNDDIEVRIRTRIPRPKASDPKPRTLFPVGPFGVNGLPRQGGSIRVRSSVPVKLTPIPKGDIQRLDPPDDPLDEPHFRYELPVGTPTSPLDLDVRPALGAILSQATHRIRRGDDGWYLRSEFGLQPLRVEPDGIEFDIPAGVPFEPNRDLVDAIVPVKEGKDRRTVRYTFAKPLRAPAMLTLEARFPIAVGESDVTLELPRVLGTIDRQATVRVDAIADTDLAITATDADGTYAIPPVVGRGFERTGLRSVNRVQLLLRPVWKDRTAHTTTDVRYTDTGGSATFRLQIDTNAGFTIPLRCDGPVRVVSCSVGTIQRLNDGKYRLQLPDDGKPDATVQIGYRFTIDATGEARLPLFRPEEVALLETRVRGRAEYPATRRRNLTAGSSWRASSADLLGDAEWALTTEGSPGPLQFAALSSISETQLLARFERAVFRVRVQEGKRMVHARYLPTRLERRTLAFTLPTTANDLSVTFNDLPLNPVVEGNLYRVQLPEATDTPGAGLELRYTEADPSWFIHRQRPPQLLDVTFDKPTLWGVQLDHVGVPLSFTETVVERFVWHAAEWLSEPETDEERRLLPTSGFFLRQRTPAAWTLIVFPTLPTAVGSAGMAIFAVWGLVRLRGWWMWGGSLLFVAFLLFAVWWFPQPTARLGLDAAVGLLAFFGLSAVIRLGRWWRRREVLTAAFRTTEPPTKTLRAPDQLAPAGSWKSS